MKKILFVSLLFFHLVLFSQVEIRGVILDSKNKPIPFASVLIKNTRIGAISNSEGEFKIVSPTNFGQILVSYLGYKSKTISYSSTNTNLKIFLKEESNSLSEIIIYSGRKKRKGNPAIKILNKVLENKRKNGLFLSEYYEYKKYEKIEFDLTNIDTTNNLVFRRVDFVLDNVKQSETSNKNLLPIFISESIYKIYGDSKNIREELLANKNSDTTNNVQTVIDFAKDLYEEYNIYDNSIKLFDKIFVSPISKGGLVTYNYVLIDSAFKENKWCYNIVYYPRRKTDIAFKGNFWVNDTTFAIKNINMTVPNHANINWAKNIYLEQSFDIINDSIFLLKKDYLVAEFSLRKNKEKSKGFFGKRTTIYKDYIFEKPYEESFYKEKVENYVREKSKKKEAEYIEKNRFEKLKRDENDIYTMMDSLTNTIEYKVFYKISEVLVSDYFNIKNFDYGRLSHTFGQNEIEGMRIRMGGRTYFSENDPFRVQGYIVYGTKDKAFKYGINYKTFLEKKNRLIFEIGNKIDIEQMGAGFTNTNEVIASTHTSSALFTTGDSSKLTYLNLTKIGTSIEPIKNVQFIAGSSYKKISSASENFSINYIYNDEVRTDLNQLELDFAIRLYPKREISGSGIEPININPFYSTVFLSFSKGIENSYSDFDYTKAQFYYKQLIELGLIGRTFTIVEAGKTFGTVPLSLLHIVPGNQSYTISRNSFSLLNYYDFITDTYLSTTFEHNFNGRIISYIPLVRRTGLREFVILKGVVGSVSEENKAIDLSGIVYQAPEDLYWEYGFGVGNIFKFLRLDFTWKGNNYRNIPEGRNFGIKGLVGFYF